MRREKYAGAIPCASYQRKTSFFAEDASPMFPLLPDAGVKEDKVSVLERPTSLWYLVPFLFGILGGIVAYVAVKDRDADMAFGLLIFGILWTVIGVILYVVAISALLSSLYPY
jgi:hypothetical protein